MGEKKSVLREKTAVAVTQSHFASPQSIIDIWIGEQLRARRKQLQMPLQSVADQCGISVSLLSQVERGLRSVSLNTLNLLSICLDKPLDQLIVQAQPAKGDDSNDVVVREGAHIRIDLADKGILKENLTPPAARRAGVIEMYRAVIEPGGSTGASLFSTAENYTVGYVIQGTLELALNDQTYMLQTGDSFFHHGSTLRRWRNSGPAPTIVLWGIGRNYPPSSASPKERVRDARKAQ